MSGHLARDWGAPLGTLVLGKWGTRGSEDKFLKEIAGALVLFPLMCSSTQFHPVQLDVPGGPTMS